MDYQDETLEGSPLVWRWFPVEQLRTLYPDPDPGREPDKRLRISRHRPTLVHMHRTGVIAALRRQRRSLGAIQERIESTVAGEAVASGIVVMVLLIGVVWSLPSSTIKRSIAPSVRPAALAFGLDQNWRVFAPNPPRSATAIEVHVLVDEDGTPRTWRPPHGNGVYGQYSWYRWQKLKESVLNPASGFDRSDFVRWVVREITDPREHPTYVEVVERIDTLPVPGSSVPSKRSYKLVYSEKFPRKP